MTIKEIEEASGMQRANIRFYEAEGFVHPEREKNGYRNYTEEDLKILKKIKLLRSLHISLEEIKAMHQGEQSLSKTLEEHIARLTQQQEGLAKSQYVCERMKQDGATYEKLNTEQYLQVLKSCRPEVKEMEAWKEADIPEPVQVPFLRIFARLFDYLFYAVLWVLLVFLGHSLFGLTKEQVLYAMVFSTFMWMPIALVLEPQLLQWFGATPGKIILGLKVTYDLGERIPGDMAWSRAWRAICMVHDWQYRDVFQTIRIYEAMSDGKPLEWDYEANTTLELKDENLWRKIVLLAATVICLMSMVLAYRQMHMLPHQGNLTAAEFAENYNARLDFYGGTGEKIDETGAWVKEPHLGNVKYGMITSTKNGETRKFTQSGEPERVTIVEENGVVMEIGFFYETESETEKLSLYTGLMRQLALTFLESQKDYNVFTFKEWKQRESELNRVLPGGRGYPFHSGGDFQDGTCTIGELTLLWDVELKGYELWQDEYVAKEGEDTYYSVNFSVKKSE